MKYGWWGSGRPVPFLAVLDFHSVVFDRDVALDVGLTVAAHQLKGTVQLIRANLTVSILVDLSYSLLREWQGNDDLITYRSEQLGKEISQFWCLEGSIAICVVSLEDLNNEGLELFIGQCCEVHKGIKRFLQIVMLARIQRIIAFLVIFLGVCCGQQFSMTANIKNAYKGRHRIMEYDWQIKREGGEDGEREYDVPLPETLHSEDIWTVTALSDFKVDKILTQGLNLSIIYLRNSQTHLTFLVRTKNENYLLTFYISYLVIRKQDFLLYNFDAFQMVVEVGQNVSIGQSFQARFSIQKTMNQTGDIHAFYVISGMDISSTNHQGIFDISSTIKIFGSSLILVIISKQSVPTYITSIAYSIIIYNQDYLFQSSYLNLNIGFKQAYFTQRDITELSFFSPQIQMLEFNTFVGLTSFRFEGQDHFFISSLVRQPYANKKGQFGFQWIVKAQSYVRSLNVSYLVIFTRYCDYLYPLYYREDFSCYSSCPGQTVENPFLLVCLSQKGSEKEDIQAELEQQETNEQNTMKWVLPLLLSLISFAFLYRKQCKDNKEDYKNVQANKKPQNQQQETQVHIINRFQLSFHSKITLS